MRRRWFGLAMAAISLAVAGYSFTLPITETSLVTAVLGGLAFLTPSLFGCYLVWRLPTNAVGWLLTGFGLTFLVGVLGEEVGPTGGSLAMWWGWLGSWMWAVWGTLLLVFLPLLFPDGRLPSRGFRWVPVTGLAGLTLSVAGFALRPSIDYTIGESVITVEIPFGISRLLPILEAVSAAGIVLMLAAMAGALIAVVRRFRRSRGIERQQLKVFVTGAIFGIIGMTIGNAFLEEAAEVGETIVGLVIVVMMGSIAVSVLRYRLYAFDRIISRTVSYGLLTTILAGVYVGSVFLLRSLFPPQGDLAVAGSTLAVAALFNPLRRRIQTLVDKRFNRSRYDASRTIEAFAHRLRSEVNMTEMARELQVVASNTMQPTSVALWLREKTTS